MRKNAKLETLFRQHGFKDFRWLDPKNIVVAHWVRMKCLFGCSEYGRTATCPPNTPSVEECGRFFREYKTAAVFHFKKKVPDPKDRFAWTLKIDRQLLKLEKAVFLAGHEKAFLLFLDSCHFCAECSGRRETCKEPRLARPSSDAMAVDVFTTVRSLGYPIEVLSDYKQTMNRYAFLLVE